MRTARHIGIVAGAVGVVAGVLMLAAADHVLWLIAPLLAVAALLIFGEGFLIRAVLRVKAFLLIQTTNQKGASDGS